MVEHAAPPLSVLVVEDQPDTAQSTAELIAMWGHRVRVAGSGPAALEAAGAEMPDVILLDIGLPEMDGWNVAMQLRSRAAGKQPLIVAVTGYEEEADKWRSADSGVDVHWVKPADPQALARLLGWVRGLLKPAASTG